MSYALVRRPTLGMIPVGLGPVGLNWLLRGGFFISVLGASYLLLKKVILSVRRQHDLSKVGTATPDGYAIGFASRCYAAIIPSGHPWVNDTVGDGTELEDLYQVARDIHRSGVSFALVSSKYRSLYDRDLLADITNDLGRGEIQKFNGLLQTGLGNPLPLEYPLAEYSLLTVKQTAVFDATLTQVSDTPANRRLGEMTETLITAGFGTFYGFTYNGQSRFVPAASARLLPLAG